MFNPSGAMSIVGFKSPKVYITPLALQKMQVYVSECSKEIGWLGEVVREGNVFVIVDTMLFKQEVHGATTEIDENNLMEVAEELLQTPEGSERYSRLKMWGHSHVNMAVTPSGQDDNQIKLFEQGNEYFIRIIANKKGEMRVDLYDFTTGVAYNCIKWEIYIQNMIDKDAIKNEMKEKVTEKVFAQTITYGQQGLYRGQYWEEYYGNKGGKSVEAKVGLKKLGSMLTKMNKASELLTIVDEDDIFEVSESTSPGIAEEVLKRYFHDVSKNDAKKFKSLADEYVDKFYGLYGGRY